MINTKYLAKYFTDMFNTYGASQSKYFKIFADEGELKKEIKEYGKQPQQFTNGIVEIISSTLTPIRGIRLNTYSVQLTMFIDLAMDGVNADKESLNLITLRDIFSKIIDDKNGSTDIIKIDNVSYSQSMTISYPTTGTKNEIGYISDCLPLYWNFNIAMFEDGVNANNCHLKINNIEIPFTRLVCTRKRTAEQNNFTSDNSTKTIMQMNGLSLDIVMPALLNNDFSNLVMQDVLTGGNYALSVELKMPTVETRFIGTLGDTQASLDVATNVGFNLSIVEGLPNILDYAFSGSQWRIEANLSGSSITINNINIGDTIYWGDGTSEVAQASGDCSHTYTDGKTKHTVRIYKYGG